MNLASVKEKEKEGKAQKSRVKGVFVCFKLAEEESERC